MILVPNDEPLREANPCHHPAGSPRGGQFCSKDAFVAAPHATRIPRSVEQAAHEIGASMHADRLRDARQRGDDLRNRYIRADLDSTYETVSRNWQKKVLARFRPEDVSPAFVAAAQRAVDQNAENIRYQRAVRRFAGGRDPVLALPQPSDDSTALSSAAAGQRLGAVSVLFQHAFWRPEASHRDVEPFPGATTSETVGGLAAVLRHEFGHHIWDTLRPQDREQWRELIRPFGRVSNSRWEYPALERTITVAAGMSDSEAFSETFAIWTHQRFRKAAFPAEVHPLFEWLDRRMGGRLIEGAVK